MPRRVVLWALAIAALLTVAGVVGERLASSAGINPIAGATGTSGSGAAPPTPPASAPGGPQIGASVAASMGIVPAHGPAAAIDLTDQRGRPFSLASLRGRVVVLTFFSSACDDICPVLEAELQGAAADLGARSGEVAFVSVNTDPLATAAAGAPAVARSALREDAGWYFLGGTLAALDEVWKSYGVTIEVSKVTGTAAHNEVMYFIDPAGRLAYRATPYAEQGAGGTWTLAPASVTVWARGIASYAERLLGAG